MRGIVFALVSACLIALVPGSASAEGSGTSAYAGGHVSPHDSVHASGEVQASVPGGGCEITGGQATVSFVTVRNPVPFSFVDPGAIIGHAEAVINGADCRTITGVFATNGMQANCVPDGEASCTTQPIEAPFISKLTPPFHVDVVIQTQGIGGSGLVSDTASCSMDVHQYEPSTMSCDLA